MKVLAIDTSSYVMGIAIIDESNVIGEMITNLKKNHSVRVMPAIKSLLEECDIKPQELEKIVVAKGPGSYTGVRIGVTIAKTLAWSLNIPLVGVSSLEVVAMNGRYFAGVISPLFDARRGQIYTGLYDYQNESLGSVEKDQIILVSDWAQMLKKREDKVLFIGNDLAIHKGLLADTLQDQAMFSPITEYNAKPSELAYLGMNKEPDDIHSFVPNYIRLAEAEAKWLASQRG